ncbi:type II toxin-antitoxin system PemK/MazF family toxin [Schinkia azotoformans]|uniref:MazF family transcriptional regulator n=1 Tax=Schinkia azotoformans LMG 9581 TaxID=1131731 RepID=K6D6C9_SCHAZ|nr:type II toxin-antitoxin system PemK/MazF family toxin [Schinkia azotoformans]EKN68057.1 MazF family transcriptional regulator [Schinkia azotoformans LMG 9581]MEC1638137.1 type II toxin-antitoxin system PemK/MazF family toxin [Schinkia azotoformans]MEC1946429.1 type II toxin-antitoxin system PemK/MazF family toxin [Schinkia azotoformans]
MDCLEFLGLPTVLHKEKKLKEMDSNEKSKLLQQQENSIILNWDSCDIETQNRLKQQLGSIDKQILHYDQLLSFSNWTFSKYTYEERKQKQMYQWDIFYCELGHNIGTEKNKTRPVLIIQKTKGYLNAKTIMIAPITIGENFTNLYKHEILIDHTERGKIRGKIDLSHIRSIDRSRLDEKYSDRLLKENEYISRFGKGNYETTQSKVNKALKRLFSIDE